MRTRTVFALIALTTLAFSTGVVAGEQSPYTQTKDVVYGESHGVGLLMDVFTPTGDKNGLAIVDVASGAWFSDRGKIRDHKQAQMYDIFCKRGYTVFAVRPGSQTRWSAADMMNHVKMGIRWVKDHAETYGIDPKRVGLVGASAGGHLAALTAVTADEEEQVKAVGVFFPPTDFLDWNGKSGDLTRIGPILFPGGAKGHSADELREQAEKISPARQIKSTPPPFLIFHGTADPLVPMRQSDLLVKAIKEAGGSAKLVIKEGGGHPWPTIHEEVGQLADWLDVQLKK